MGVEIRLRGTAIPCIAQEDIKSGLAVKLVNAANSPKIRAGDPIPDPRLQGSIYDVKLGAELPAGRDDAEAKYVAAFRVYNETPPLYETLPTNDEGGGPFPYTMRGFVKGTENMPATVKLRMVVPRLKYDETIPSGSLMLAYDEGIYTVTSGCFEVDTYEPGDILGVAAGGTWEKKNSVRVGMVWEYNATQNTLTIKTD